MKYFIEKCVNTKHGYRLVEVDSDGVETYKELNSKTTDNYLRMPVEVAEATNRQLVSIAMIEKSGQDRFEVEWREAKTPRVLGKSDKKVTKSESVESLADWLSSDQKEVFLDLVKQAYKAKRIAELKAEIEAQQAVLAELEK